MSLPYSTNYDLTMGWSDDSAQLHLTAGNVLSYTVPGNSTDKYSIRFSYTDDSNVFVRKNADPVTPAGDTITTTRFAEFKPGYDGSQRYAIGGDTIRFVSPDADAYCGLRLMKIPTP